MGPWWPWEGVEGQLHCHSFEDMITCICFDTSLLHVLWFVTVAWYLGGACGGARSRASVTFPASAMAQEGLCSLCGLILSSCLVIRDSLNMLAWKSSSCSCDPRSLTCCQAENDVEVIAVPDDATSLHYGCFVYSNCAVCFNWMCCWHLDNASHGPWNASGGWGRVQ